MKNNNKKMELSCTGFGYDYYTGTDAAGRLFYNLVPIDSPAPKGGYYDKEYILKIKQVPDLFGNILLNQ